MTATTIRLLRDRDGSQSTATVMRAEVRKLLRQGGLRGWLIVATVLGFTSGVTAVFMSGTAAIREIGGISAADVATSGPVVVSFVLCLAATHHIPREVADGTVMTARYLVPRTGVLFCGRMLAWCAVAVGFALVTALAPLPLILIWGDVIGSSLLELTAGLVTSLGLAALLVGLSQAAATLLQRGALVVAVGMTMLVVLPLVITLGSFATSGVVATALLQLSRIVLGSLLVIALQVPTSAGQDWGPWAWSMVGLILWWVATTALAYLAFRRPGYGDT